MDVFKKKKIKNLFYLLYFYFSITNVNSTRQATTFGLTKNHIIPSQVKNVTQQSYKLQVHDEFVIKGNNAVFLCNMPSFIKEFVQVVAWYKDDQLLISQASIPNDKFSLLANGELYIRNSTLSDVGLYRCQTKDLLTGQLVTSSTAGKLQITETHGSQAPRIIYFTSSVVQRGVGEQVELGCLAQAWPLPQYNWFRELANGLLQPIDLNSDILQRDGTILFRSLSLEHSGKYFCEIRNSLGEERVNSILLVTKPLRIQLSISKPEAEVNKLIQLNCSISGSPLNTIYWFKDGQPLLINEPIQYSQFKTSSLLKQRQESINFQQTFDESNIKKDDFTSVNNAQHNSILTIHKVARKDAGVYQCFAANSFESQQASVELKIGDLAPIILNAFTSQTLNEGDSLSLRCVATGSPLPQIQWYLDSEKVPLTLNRYKLNDFVSQNNHDQVISYLNISKLQSIDSGEFRCIAFNEIGQASNVARINIYGKPALRPFAPTNLTLVEGRSVALKCPIVSYPIEKLSWRFNDKQQLPANHRQKIESIVFDSNGKPNTGRTLWIENIQKNQDEGVYTCTIVQKKQNESYSLEANLYVTIKIPPLIDNQLLPEKVFTEENMRVKLVCSIVQGNSPSIKWLKNGELLSSSSNHISIQKSEDYSLLTFKQVQENDAGNYSCIATNDVETAIRSTLLVVNILPRWLIEPPTQLSAVLGSKLIVDCDASGWPRPRISWRKTFNNNYLNTAQSVLKSNSIINNEETSKENYIDKIKLDNSNLEFREILSGYRHQVYGNGSLIIQDVDNSDEGYLMCQVSNGVGAGLSRVMYLKVNVPPYFESKFVSVSVKKGEQCILNCDVIGDLPMIFMWQKDKQPLDRNFDHRVSIVNSNTTQPGNINVNSKLIIQQTTRLDSALYTCEAKNEFGSDETNIQLIVTEPPEAPSLLEIRDRTSRSITITWKMPFSGNSPILKFIIEHRQLGQLNWEKSTKPVLNNGELIFSLKGLKPITDYEIRLQAENALGLSPFSSILTCKTAEEIPAGAPLYVLVEPSGAQSLKVKWRAPKKELRTTILGYYIGYRLVSSLSDLEEDQQYNYKNFEIHANSTATDDSEDRQFVTYITNLRAKSLYSIIVQAYNSAGTGPRSEPISQSTLSGSPPITPIIEAVQSSFYFIIIRWYSSSDDRSNIEHLETSYYSLYYRADSDMNFSKKELHSNSTDLNMYTNSVNQSHKLMLGEYKLDNLKCGTKYEIYMTATNSLGTGEASERIFARTHGLPPYPPGPLNQFIVRNSTSLLLRLNKFKTDGCPIKSFRIQYRQEIGSMQSDNNDKLNSNNVIAHRWTVLNKDLNSAWSNNKEPSLLQINHLQANTLYNIQVQAKSDAGITEEEYLVKTLNRSEVFYLESDDENNDLVHNEHNTLNPADDTIYVYRQFALLLPVAASIFVLLLLVIFMFVCLRKQSSQFPGMQLDRFALPLNSNAKQSKDAAFLNQTAHEQLVLSEYQKLNCPSSLNTNSTTLPLDNCSYPDLCSNQSIQNSSIVNNQLQSATIKKFLNSSDICDQINSSLLLNDNAYSKMCTNNNESLYYSSPIRKSAGNLVDCCGNLNNLNNLNNNLLTSNEQSNLANLANLSNLTEHQNSCDPLVGLILKGQIQSNHDYAEPYTKQARNCLIDSQDMVLLPTFCTNQQIDNSTYSQVIKNQLDNATYNQTIKNQLENSNYTTQTLSTTSKKQQAPQIPQSPNNLNKTQQLRMVRINNNCNLAEQSQTYATVKRKSTNQRTLSTAQSANFSNLLNQNNLE